MKHIMRMLSLSMMLVMAMPLIAFAAETEGPPQMKVVPVILGGCLIVIAVICAIFGKKKDIKKKPSKLAKYKNIKKRR